MSAHKKIHLAASRDEENSANSDTRQRGGGKPVKGTFDIKMSLKERARLMLDYPKTPIIHNEADDEMPTPISDSYRTLNGQSIRTRQMCMDAELQAITAIEARVTTELRLIETDYECIALEVRARKTLAEKLQQAEKAVAVARSRENAALNDFDTIMQVSEINDEKLMEQQLQALAQRRQDAEIRALNMQRIRMDAEQCAIQEIESLVENEDLISSYSPNQYLNEESILQMALENGLLATHANFHASECNSQTGIIDANAEACRLLDDMRNTSWGNLIMESPTLH
ncbi:MAG: hypothetical protein WB870_17095 [Gallionellaceae bacterium]